jgi:fibro-slime domain-containing protein
MKNIGLLRASLTAALFLSVFGGAFGQATYKDTIWLPVIFYDYWVDANGTNPDFEISPASMQGFPGMVYDTMDFQRKPVPTPAACPTPSNAAPAACHLSQWFRVSGVGGSDQSCIFTCDSVTNPQKRQWKWTTATGAALTPNPLGTGGFVGPNYDQTYNMRNIVFYDSIPFRHLGNGIYEINNPAFFPLDNRGFGNQPSGQNHNFGMAMELHTTFSYKKGLNFTFAGDDDCWVFIDGKMVVDLGGRHGTLERSVNLDTLTRLKEGYVYNLDFFYAERHTTGSDIRITSNMIAPSKIAIQVLPSPTIYPGDTAKITGTLLDGSGNVIPGTLSDSITWAIDPATQKTGDILLISKGRTTNIIAGPTTVSRTVTVIGTYGSASVTGQVQITILPAIPKTFVIYNSESAPGPAVLPLPDPSQFITINAGTQYLLVGNVFDKYTQWLSQYRIAPDQNKISWSANDRSGSLNSKLDALTGAVIHFTPTQAYDTVTIIATLNATTSLMDTVRFIVKPGKEKYLVIEPKGNLNLIHPNPLDTLQILNNETSKSVYTTVRDTFGNFIRYGTISPWVSFNTSMATVIGGDPLFGEGIVTKDLNTLDTITQISATDNTLKDTCYVYLAKYFFTELRIVIGSNTDPTNLNMNTNQDTTLKVQGKRSDNQQWVDVTATWENSANLKISPTAPTSPQWRFSPSDTGTGWIRVTLNNDGVTKPDTLPVVFTPGPPVRASIEIITPGADIIAGKPVQAVVKVYDKDGNSYTYKFDTTAGSRAAYHDLLGTGGLPEPVIIIDGKTVVLYGTPWDYGNETFLNGRDTVTFTLYNAPLDTSKVHQISLNLVIGADTIKASSVPFVLHPDVLAKVQIEYPNGTPVTDTLNLTSFSTFVSRGYDRYGNPLGEIPGNWSVTDSLHQITGPTNGSTITYDPNNVTRPEKGYVIIDHNGIKDSVYVILTGQLIKLVSAITRDVSGNGILDQIELNFSRKFSLPAGASFAGLAIVYNNDTLRVDRILNTGTGDDSVWVVQLVETHTDLPQTGWTPTVVLPLQSAYQLAAMTVTSIDGAGPVVWRVVKYPVVANNFSLDTVVVTFSEPIQRWDGGALNPADQPDSIFYVWKKDDNDTTKFVLVKDMFSGINNLKRDPGKSNSITFTMSNGNNLSRAYYLSLADTAMEYVTDTSAHTVKPNLNNQPRQVYVNPIPGPLIIPFNPVGPTFKREDPAVFNPVNNPNADKWVKADRGRGAVMEFSFSAIPPEVVEPGKNAQVSCKIRIYDIIGNVVQSRENPNFQATYTQNELQNQSSVDAKLYWNGSNDEGMAVAPGVYRIVVYVQYLGINAANRSKYKDQRMVGKLGIQR